ncbi:MAG: undecaprenyl-diphosphate phosphatase [Deltaproteobacteria bacterium]|nr:undecaprenyl-diphosphate phosphatase [Deltaproteobacteria bacterium]
MEHFDSLTAAFLGALQGITEFLPVSSSAHLIVASWFFSGKALPLELNVSLHVGTFGAVLLYFRSYWWQLGNGFWRKARYGERSFSTSVLFPCLLWGSVPAALFGFFGKDLIEHFFHNPTSTLVPLAGVGIVLWLADTRAPRKRALGELKLRDGLLIGLAQACALIPGVSRSGATIIGGRLLGFKKKDAVEFSFLLGTPAMLGAALLSAKDMFAYADSPTFYLGVGVSFVSGYLTIKYFIKFLARFNFLAFAVYRLALCAVILSMITLAEV